LGGSFPPIKDPSQGLASGKPGIKTFFKAYYCYSLIFSFTYNKNLTPLFLYDILKKSQKYEW